MLRNYLKIALRHLHKNKLYAFVNIIGLAIGICSCLLIGIYIAHELSYDKFHQNHDRITRVTWEYNFGDAVTHTSSTGTKAGPEFKRQFPEVQQYVRTLKFPRVIAYEDKLFDEKNFLYADSTFFSVFSFPLIHGDPANVLASPDQLVITESAARKYFGSDNPIGKVVKVAGTKNFVVTGIAKDVPSNTQVKFDFVGTFSSLNAAKTEKWNEANYVTYLMLDDARSILPLQSKIDAYAKKIGRDEMKLEENQYMRFHLEKLAEVRLHSKQDGFEPNSSITYIYILAAVAILIMLIACVNYTNLSTAQSASRSGEIGIRKVMGAEKGQVFRQFISESLLVTFIAVFISLVFAALLLPYFNQIAGKSFTPEIFFHPVSLTGLFVLAVTVAFSAGSYPALVLSNSKVIQVLKSGFNFTGSSSLRKSLIVFQFVISIFLIISTIIILQQMAFIKNKDLGYDKEQILVLPVDRLVLEKYDEFKKEIASHSGVTSVAGAYEEPTHIGWSDGIQVPGIEKPVSVNAFPADEHIVKTLGLKIIAGSDFNSTDVAQFDTSDGGSKMRYSFMLNESAAQAIGWKPQEAIGKTIVKNVEGVVKAVVADFHFRSFHEQINPLVIFYDKRLVSTMFVKIQPQQTSSIIASIDNIWKKRFAHRPFEYHFLDEDYNALYKSEERTAGVFTTFSSLAIMLACLGLFALTAFTMVKRTKEIGIRKIMGATISDILLLISKDFMKLIVVALIIAAPLAFYAGTNWLQNFNYRIELQWWIFLAAGVVTMIIAFLTISAQAIRAALANPVSNLRSE